MTTSPLRKPAGAPGSVGGQFDGRGIRTPAGNLTTSASTASEDFKLAVELAEKALALKERAAYAMLVEQAREVLPGDRIIVIESDGNGGWESSSEYPPEVQAALDPYISQIRGRTVLLALPNASTSQTSISLNEPVETSTELRQVARIANDSLGNVGAFYDKDEMLYRVVDNTTYGIADSGIVNTLLNVHGGRRGLANALFNSNAITNFEADAVTATTRQFDEALRAAVARLNSDLNVAAFQQALDEARNEGSN